MFNKEISFDLSEKLTTKFLSNSVINKYFHTIDELKELTEFDSNELLTLFSKSNDDLHQHFYTLGSTLNKKYNLSIEDVTSIIQFLEEELITASDHKIIDVKITDILKRSLVVKQSIAEGFLFAMIESIKDFLSFNKEKYTSALGIHKEWFLHVSDYILKNTDKLPKLDHLTCNFAPWLQSLEFQLHLHSMGEKKNAMQAKIFFAHREIHEQASNVLSFCENNEFILAVSHMSKLFEASLMLEEYIRYTHLQYLEYPEKVFFNYINEKTKYEKELYFFTSIVISSNNSSNIKEFLKQNTDNLTNLIRLEAHKNGFDSISFIDSATIHVLVKYTEDVNDQSVNDLIHNVLHPKIKNVAIESGFDIQTIGLEVDRLYQLSNDVSSILVNLKYYQSEQEVLMMAHHDIEVLYNNHIENLEIIQSIDEAFENDLFEIFFQPIVHGKEHRGTLFAETLVRLPYKGAYLSAEKFIFILEKQHRMLELDLYVLRKLKENVSRLKNTVTRVSVNIYPSSISDQKLYDAIKDLAKEFDKYEIKLVVEITEQTLIGSIEPLKDLALNHNIVFAVDDFGSGYSNFINLIEMTDLGIVQVMKIDGTLIRDVQKNSSRLSIIKILCDMALSLQLEPVILEYVENEETLHMIKDMPGNVLFQGYYFDKALPIEELIAKYHA